MTPTMNRMRLAAAMLIAVLVVGTVGYRLFGCRWTDAAYQTVTTVTTVGFREVSRLDREKGFTIGLIIVGVGTALYTLRRHAGRRRGSPQSVPREAPDGRNIAKFSAMSSSAAGAGSEGDRQ